MCSQGLVSFDVSCNHLVIICDQLITGFDVTTDEPKVDTATCLMFREMAEGKKHEAYVLRIEGKRDDPLLTLDLISCDTADDITLAISRMIVTSDTAQ